MRNKPQAVTAERQLTRERLREYRQSPHSRPRCGKHLAEERQRPARGARHEASRLARRQAPHIRLARLLGLQVHEHHYGGPHGGGALWAAAAGADSCGWRCSRINKQ